MDEIKDEDIDLGDEILSTSINETCEEKETIDEIHACRVCLLTDCRLYSLTRLCMEEVYRTVTGLPLSHEDSLPRTLCAECVVLLNKCYQFRQKSQRGYYCLMGILENHSEVTLDMIKEVNRKKVKLESNLTITETLTLEHQFIDVPETLIEEKVNEIKEEVGLDYDASGNENRLDTINDDANSTENDFTSFKDNKLAIEIPYKIVKKKNTQHMINEEFTVENVGDGFIQINEEFKTKPVPNVVRNNKEKVMSNHSENPKAELKRGRKKQQKVKSKDRISIQKQYNAKHLKLLKENFLIKSLSLNEQKEELCKRKQTDNYLKSPFKCEYCFQGFKGDATYNTHMMKHSEKNGSLTCDVCHMRRPKKHSMNNHLQYHLYLYSCLTCSYTTQNRASAKLHMDWHKGKSYKCTICEEVYRRSSSLLSHLRVKHPSDNVCIFCGYSFIGEFGLKFHRRMKHRQEKEEISSDSPRCVGCDIQFVSKAALQTHQQVSLRHATAENIKRNESQYSTKKDDDTRGRGRGRVKKEDVPKNRRDGQTRVTCEECGRHFLSLQSLRIHMAAVHRVSVPKDVASSLLCEQCGRAFRCLAVLRDHATVHLDKASFTCKVCGKSFKTRTSLRTHSYRHSEKQRITSQQRRLMLDFVKQCPPLATNKFSGPNGALLREKYLIKMSNSLNSVGFGPKKTPEKWLRSWLDWKSDVKGKASAIARYQQGSVGGPPPTPLSPIEDELVRFIGTEVVTGMEGVPETLSIPNTPPDTDTIDETPSSRDRESVPSPSRGEQQQSATTATSNPRAIPEPPQKRKKVEKEATESDNIAAAMLSQSQALDNVAHQMGRMADSMSLMSNI